MKSGLNWLTIQIDRRGFLQKTAATTFGILAGLSIGKAQVVLAAPCTGPYGSGPCGGDLCINGWQCNPNGTGASCSYDTYYHYPGACWHPYVNSNCTCCDCYCCSQNHGCSYCYCYGGC